MAASIGRTTVGTGKHQHIVPQQMIKRFTATDGKLVGLYKPRLSIGKRRRSPKGILFKDDFYQIFLLLPICFG